MIYPLQLDYNWHIFQAFNFDKSKRIKAELEKIKGFENKLIYYNKHIQNLASLTISKVSFEWHYDKPEIEIYCGCKDCRNKNDSEKEQIFLELRNKEVNGLVTSINKFKNYKAKLNLLFNTKGFNSQNTFSIYSNASLNKIAINYEKPLVDLWPRNRDEKIVYNEFVQAEFNKIAYNKNEFTKEYKGFDSRKEKDRLHNTLKNSSDRNTLLEYIKNQIEKKFNYPESLKIDDGNTNKHIIKDINKQLDSKSIKRNLFAKMMLGIEVDLNAIVLDYDELNYYTHISEIFKFFCFVKDLIENPSTLEILPSDKPSENYFEAIFRILEKPFNLIENVINEFENSLKDKDEFFSGLTHANQFCIDNTKYHESFSLSMLVQLKEAIRQAYKNMGIKNDCSTHLDENNETVWDMASFLSSIENKNFERLTQSLQKLETYINKNIFEDVRANLPRLKQLNRNLTNWKYQIMSVFVEPIKEGQEFVETHLNENKKLIINKLENKISGALEVLELRIKDKENILLNGKKDSQPEHLKITNSDRLLRELDIIENIFKAQFQKYDKTNPFQYPTILDKKGQSGFDGKYIASIDFFSNVVLFNIQLHKEEFTRRFENSLDTTLLKNQLLEIYSKAIKTRDYYNKNLTRDKKIVSDYLKTKELPFKEEHEKFKEHCASIVISDYRIGEIYFDQDTGKFITDSQFRYISNNQMLAFICQDVIDFIDKFNLRKDNHLLTTDKATHREIIIAHNFKYKAGIENDKTPSQWKTERGEKARQSYYTTLKQSHNYKEPTVKELSKVIELLETFPEAQKMAIKKRIELESL